MEILFCNTPDLVSEELITDAFNKAEMIVFGKDFNLATSISFASEIEIKQLNNKHRNKDKVTDVLSFPLLELNQIPIAEYDNERDYDTNLLDIGDIVICTEVATKQAEEFGHSVTREIAFLAIHGLLHLFGFDHETKEEEEKMMAIAESVLKLKNIGR